MNNKLNNIKDKLIKEICYNLAKESGLLETGYEDGYLDGNTVDTFTPSDLGFILSEKGDYIWDGNVDWYDFHVVNYDIIYSVGNYLICQTVYSSEECDFEDFKLVKSTQIVSTDYIELNQEELLTLKQ